MGTTLPFPIVHLHGSDPSLSFHLMIGAIREPEFGDTADGNRSRTFVSHIYLALAGEDDLNLGSVDPANNLVNNVPGSMVHSFGH
jgi:hypothetical protein